MICHPVILGSKLVVLIVIIVVLVILHSYLTPDQFRVAVIIGAAIFLCFSFVLWIAFFKLLNNPESKMAKQMVLSQQARTENGFQASSDEFASLVGNRGVAFSPLRQSPSLLITLMVLLLLVMTLLKQVKQLSTLAIRIIHHRQATATGQTVCTNLAGIVIAFFGQDHTGLDSRIIR